MRVRGLTLGGHIGGGKLGGVLLLPLILNGKF